MSENNILIYPILKKYEKDLKKTNVDVEDIRDMTNHYMEEFINNLINHNIEIDQELVDDMKVAEEFMVSAIMRHFGKYHVMQDLVDTVLTDENGEIQ